jgi:hypothetical protein
MLRQIPLILVCLLCLHCASEGLPGGGPPDNEAPRLIQASLRSGSTGVDSLEKLNFVFSEALNPRNAEKNITLFPLGATEIRIRVRGRSINIEPLKAWDPNLVYTLILGKNISDLRNNTRPEPLQFSFTCADRIPENRIEGRIYELEENRTAVVCISRRSSHPDSILTNPEYFTQGGSGGHFAFHYLPHDTFYVAGYIDLDKSNSYQPRLDGRLVPSEPFIVPDSATAQSGLHCLAVHDHFLPPRLLKAESIYPSETRLEFTKKPDPATLSAAFSCNGQSPDTVLTEKKTCVLYHRAIKTDSLRLQIRNFLDHLNCPMPDSGLTIAVQALQDSLYRFTQEGKDLFVTPPPGAALLNGILETAEDTLELSLTRLTAGIYRIPEHSNALHGQFRLRMPAAEEYPQIATDSLYSIPLQLPVPEEYGSVIGTVSPGNISGCRVVLINRERQYETLCSNGRFVFSTLLPGNYDLKYYIDANGNGRRDAGRPYPYIPPEIPYLLDTGISVRARWDTELSDRYQIEVEK